MGPSLSRYLAAVGHLIAVEQALVEVPASRCGRYRSALCACILCCCTFSASSVVTRCCLLFPVPAVSHAAELIPQRRRRGVTRGRRLMRTRHISRVPYLVDCARLLALLPDGGGAGPATGVGEGGGGRLPRGATGEFLSVLRPHRDLLNAFIR